MINSDVMLDYIEDLKVEIMETSDGCPHQLLGAACSYVIVDLYRDSPEKLIEIGKMFENISCSLSG